MQIRFHVTYMARELQCDVGFGWPLHMLSVAKTGDSN